jgi:ABC-type Fe3+/spermidine/putrescine transport system ATPase subunit
MTDLTLTGLTKTYVPGGPSAIADLSLGITSGGLTALLGPSGCGKTTALKIVAGLLAPDAGDVRFDGQSVLPLPAERRSAVMVHQNALLFPYMTVAENIGFGLRMQHLPNAQIARQVDAMLDAVRLPGLGPRKPAQLSGGQAQRVALARALILRPRVLLLDEPLSNLDAHLREDMRDLIRDLQRETGITTLMVTHDQAEAVALADRIALMLDGRLRQHDRPEAFYDRPADRDVARFFGGCNFVAGHATDGLFTSALGPLSLPPGLISGPATLTFRPEAVRLGHAPQNSITARVAGVTFRGGQTRLSLDAGGTVICADLPPDSARNILAGDTLPIHLPAPALWLLA